MISSNQKQIEFINEPNLIPLLDFFLILVVMLALMVGPIQSYIKINLPELQKKYSQTNKTNNHIISILKTNQIYLDGKLLTSTQELEQKIHNKGGPIKSYKLAVDSQLPSTNLIKILTILKKNNIKIMKLIVKNKN
ncbi:ExbD/TolR family protein [Paraphotobacterium marinum]|uniref:ExbD/TolR family protein n=1 Tax=Paraphotobacterium marinum TaxID=1755811 RepID=UPI0039ED1744